MAAFEAQGMVGFVAGKESGSRVARMPHLRDDETVAKMGTRVLLWVRSGPPARKDGVFFLWEVFAFLQGVLAKSEVQMVVFGWLKCGG